MGARPRATVDRAFGHFAWSQSASQMAARVGEAAMPLIALAMHIPNAQIGLISFAQFLPVMLFTLLFGAWIDGTSKSTPMLVGHAGRAMVFGILGWLAAIDQLGLPVLLAGVFVAGTFTAAFDVAVQGIVPQLVAPSRLIAANGRVQLTYSVAQVVGPSLAGFLVGLSQPFVALLVIAATYAIACAVFAPARAASPRPERTGGSRPNVFGRLWEESGSASAIGCSSVSSLRGPHSTCSNRRSSLLSWCTGIVNSTSVRACWVCSLPHLGRELFSQQRSCAAVARGAPRRRCSGGWVPPPSHPSC